MKIKTLVAVLFLSAGATSVAAQDATSICIPNSSVSHEAVRAGNFKDAYAPWKASVGNLSHTSLLYFYGRFYNFGGLDG